MSSTCDEINNKLGKCEVCDADSAKYSCPRCELKTCSLKCVAIHKDEVKCNGERDKTAYKRVSEFTNLDLLSDYRMLEDIGRTVDTCKRNPLKKYTRHHEILPNHLCRLKAACKKRGTILHYLPQHFSRHKDNSTYLNFSNQIVYWHIEFIFPQGECIKILEEKVDENETLSKLLSKYLTVEKCPEIYRPYLKFYHSTDMTDIEVLLKAEQVSKNKFILLDLSCSMKENLENKIILEYPTIYVIRKGFKDEYNIIDEGVVEDTKVDIFPKFLPFNYFDAVRVNPSEDLTARNNAISISNSVKELKKLMKGDVEGSSDELEIEEEEIPEPKFKRPLHIPYYNDL